MKADSFSWAWNNHESQPDPCMTRARAARLLRAWRNTSRRPTSMGSMLRKLEKVGRHAYKVTQLGYNETATLIIGA